MTDYLLYCRAGYEADVAAEIDDKLAKKGGYGFAKLIKNKGFLRYSLQSKSALPHIDLPHIDNLIFARQKLHILKDLSFDDTQDRILSILTALDALDLPMFGDVYLEYADTEEGRTIAKFCKKFTVPLRSALRKHARLTKKENSKKPYLHLFFEQSGHCVLAYSNAEDRNSDFLGIRRLKFPHDAPSRSTLKLEEAISLFYTNDQQAQLFNKGMTAVDLGACPGGWTYQLVSRGLKVEAVDNGAIAESLISTGMVKHYALDGFAYRPQDGHVDWLVCDMIEKPDKVAELMLQWLKNNWASATIFNLKLPMKKRYQTVDMLISKINNELHQDSGVILKAKHLYHNRDEVTVTIIKNAALFELT
ncbi:23S rRNA (cytidine(2498)-2'-O)-methyltransferase RlmM [Agaribacter marinus]|uniref:Ribosomal RNA large subunit methyltransferase M n=1 Tax=Agaribacter marinus TaxID=1431249 RepID=A0AA37WHQ6_9ALTE|nr:23S rRNA (cytidine(2498)-2'-O)-methyltransferase RlmM [Agaribacter marinus]GLR70233.1 ribosomal RNA large subunit methyltransferase M [Agaribacter marinus]